MPAVASIATDINDRLEPVNRYSVPLYVIRLASLARDRTGLDWTGLGWLGAGMGWLGTGLDWTGLASLARDWTGCIVSSS